MEIHGKVWGHTSPIFCHNNVEVHRIEGVAGGYSSKHLHRAKYNKFFVESGVLCIKIWKSYGLVDETILRAGQSCIVPPGQHHQFKVLEDAVAYEIYWVELDVDDIEREDSGGID